MHTPFGIEIFSQLEPVSRPSCTVLARLQRFNLQANSLFRPGWRLALAPSGFTGV